MRILRGIAIIFLGIGLLTAAVGVFFGIRTQRLVKQGATVTGVVVENVVTEAIDHSSRPYQVSRTYAAKVRFRAPGGEEIVFVSHAGFGRPAYREGEAVAVLYDTAHPQIAEIKSFWSLWLGPILAGMIGGLFALVALGILRWVAQTRAMTSGVARGGV